MRDTKVHKRNPTGITKRVLFSFGFYPSSGKEETNKKIPTTARIEKIAKNGHAGHPVISIT
jgi:hypothetical protein